jgi:hypothetical protein
MQRRGKARLAPTHVNSPWSADFRRGACSAFSRADEALVNRQVRLRHASGAESLLEAAPT